MMMVPYMFHDALLDDWFQSDWDRDFDRMMRAADPRHVFGKRSANVMKTDVRETETGYEYVRRPAGLQERGCEVGPAERLPDHHGQPPRGPGREGRPGPLHPSGAVHRFLRPQLCVWREIARGDVGELLGGHLVNQAAQGPAQTPARKAAQPDRDPVIAAERGAPRSFTKIIIDIFRTMWYDNHFNESCRSFSKGSRPYGQPGPLPMATLVALLIELKAQIL